MEVESYCKIKTQFKFTSTIYDQSNKRKRILMPTISVRMIGKLVIINHIIKSIHTMNLSLYLTKYGKFASLRLNWSAKLMVWFVPLSENDTKRKCTYINANDVLKQFTQWKRFNFLKEKNSKSYICLVVKTVCRLYDLWQDRSCWE